MSKKLNGVKHLILGNHDEFAIDEYFKVFNKVHGFVKYKGCWLSHAPIHPNSLRGKINIHGHMHSNALDDSRYICVSVEKCNGIPITFDAIRAVISIEPPTGGSGE
jgi:calcineurin-like phosphoesterase family protein